MNKHILTTEVQDFILKNLKTDTTRLLLAKDIFRQVSNKELAVQIESKNACEKKLSSWFSQKGIYYPQKLSIEQTSSETAAQYKSGLIKGENCIDLTGGFGVDSVYFSKKAKQVIYCEFNEELSAISKHNAKIFGINNIRFINGDGLDYLFQQTIKFDTIYIDPSRRVNTQKVFKLKDYQPDVVKNLNLLLSKTSRLIIKTSPLLDIQSGLQEFGFVSEIHIVSIKNDCKELLWIIDNDFHKKEPEIKCIAIDDIQQEFKFKLSEEKDLVSGLYANPLKYIYEPDVALLKAGCFKLITIRFNVLKLDQHTHLYTSNDLKTDFIGRTFELIQILEYRDFIKQKTLKQANVICRNFPLNAEDIKKKYRIKDGGKEYLIFTTNSKKQLLVLSCNRLN
ncbi:MAG: RsmD family RNA methyltransferase [Daejeonella sp.]